MKKIKILIVLLTPVLLSCTKKEKLEEQFIANKNEYWAYKDYCYDSAGNYYQFREDGVYDCYLGYAKEGFRLFNNDGDLVNESRTWSIKNDSTFVFDEWSYRIEKISKNEILLSYYHHEIKDKKCYVRLTKWLSTPKGPKPLDQADNIKK